MIVTIVRFPKSDPISPERAIELFSSSAASYLEVPGLLWKAYIHSEDGTQIGGIYWWKDRASAEAKYNPGWLAGLTKKYGSPPQIEWLENPVAVDVQNQAIHVEAPTPDSDGL